MNFLGFGAVLEFQFRLAGAVFAHTDNRVEGDQGIVAVFRVFEAGIKRPQIEGGHVIRLEVEVQAQRLTLAIQLSLAHQHFFQSAGADVVPAAIGFHIVGTEIPIFPAGRQRHAKVVSAVTQTELS